MRDNKRSIAIYLGLVSTAFVLSVLKVPHYIDTKKTLYFIPIFIS